MRSGFSSAVRSVSEAAGQRTGSTSTANSSSPTRPVTASSGKAAARREPRAASTRSARSWPRASLRRLRRSRSAATSTWRPGRCRRSRAAPRKLRRANSPVRASVSAGTNRASSAATPAARTPSSSQTPRHRQAWPPRMVRRTSIGVPGSRMRSRSSAKARSCGRVRARRAVEEDSGASGPRPMALAAPDRRSRSSPGSQVHSRVSAAPSASSTMAASQMRLFDCDSDMPSGSRLAVGAPLVRTLTSRRVSVSRTGDGLSIRR